MIFGRVDIVDLDFIRQISHTSFIESDSTIRKSIKSWDIDVGGKDLLIEEFNRLVDLFINSAISWEIEERIDVSLA
ncbi:MAG: hypothetical protein EOO43_22505 [Flavobacterium sp.]|nr:MAG: hypothetical protein EOO43_22505 [Flavobacterium sp.]